MKFVTTLASLTLFALAAISPVSHAQDTDLFMTSSTGSTARPNVLFMLDNSANWESNTSDGVKKFYMEQAALASAVANLEEGKFNVGLMLFTEKPGGGYIRYAVREMNATNKANLVNVINNLKISTEKGVKGDKGSRTEFGPAMHEAYLYFKGLDAYAGHNEPKTDSAAFSVKPKYKSPSTDACAKNHIIVISNGNPASGENSSAETELGKLGGKLNGDPIPLNPSGNQANWMDEYARFMFSNNINTFTIDVNPLTNGQGPDNTALLKSAAIKGGGISQYYAVYNGADLALALKTTLDEIQAVNSVFAATALPVSVNVRGTYLNEVYMAMFRPDATAKPRWFGNLKLFQLAIDSGTGELYLADADGAAAQSSVTGFIKSTAKSFWTSTSSYWSFAPRGTPESASDSPDGEIVEKGGSAQMQRQAWTSTTNRKLYTCTGGCTGGSLLSGTPFNSTNVSATDLGFTATDTTNRDLLIAWMRGLDNTSPVERAANEVRPSIHGDVVHSRPAVINYNSTGDDTDIVVFYGANDGVFRAVKGGKTGTGVGTELWGFVPSEFFGKLNRLRANTPKINVPSKTDVTTDNKPYFMDGNVSTYTLDANNDGKIKAADGDKAYIYISARRGGRFVYALDVSDPAAPKLLWKRSNTSTDYAELGQSWSEAKFATIKLGSTSTPVLIMGGGYDTAEDTLPAGTTTMGRGVFVINALNGNVIWQAGTGHGLAKSIPADITVIDRNGDGFADRAYAVDTGANIWRIDIGDTSTSNWVVNKLASLGGTLADARKFLFGADVVFSSDANGDYDAVLIGSGDREKPFDTTVTNHFFMIKDRHVHTTGAGQATITLGDLYNATTNQIQVGTTEEQDAARTALLNAKGWYITLLAGEKVVGGATTLAGTVFFATNKPKTATGECTSNLGDARIYAMSYKDATATLNLNGVDGLTSEDRYQTVPGGGFPPPPTPVVVEIDGEKEQTVCFGPTCISPPGVDLDKRQRIYWHKAID